MRKTWRIQEHARVCVLASKLCLRVLFRMRIRKLRPINWKHWFVQSAQSSNSDHTQHHSPMSHISKSDSFRSCEKIKFGRSKIHSKLDNHHHNPPNHQSSKKTKNNPFEINQEQPMHPMLSIYRARIHRAGTYIFHPILKPIKKEYSRPVKPSLNPHK